MLVDEFPINSAIPNPFHFLQRTVRVSVTLHERTRQGEGDFLFHLLLWYATMTSRMYMLVWWHCSRQPIQLRLRQTKGATRNATMRKRVMECSNRPIRPIPKPRPVWSVFPEYEKSKMCMFLQWHGQCSTNCWPGRTIPVLVLYEKLC